MLVVIMNTCPTTSMLFQITLCSVVTGVTFYGYEKDNLIKIYLIKIYAHPLRSKNPHTLPKM